MAVIKVTSSKLTESAGQIENYIKELEQEFAALKSNANRLLSYWEGDAKQAFVDSVNQNAALLTAFTTNAKKFSEALKSGATNYDTGENKAKQIASTKR